MGRSDEVGGAIVAGGGSSGMRAAAVEGVGAAAGCGGGAGGVSGVRGSAYLSAAGSPGLWKRRHTSPCRIACFFYTPVACGRGFHRCSSGRCRGLGRSIVRAWCGLWLRWLLFLFAAAEEAAEASFDLG